MKPIRNKLWTIKFDIDNYINKRRTGYNSIHWTTARLMFVSARDAIYAGVVAEIEKNETNK